VKSYDAGPTDTPILEQTIGENFEQTVRGNPAAEALVDVASDRRWTYGELNADVDLIARGLMALGIEPGERVGIWAPNCAEWTIVQYATAKIGAILVNVNPAYRTHELAYVLNQSAVRTLISATAFKTSDYVGMVEEGELAKHLRRRDRDRAADPHVVTGQQRAHQHPVHLGHHGFPEGRHAVTPEHPQQRVLRHRADQPGSG
jgi:acyl-CoA synthetase (AMP-forming)/AMP-acid ligase II